MDLESKHVALASGISLPRLTLLLVASILATAAFWHVVYDASIVIAVIVAAELVVLVAFAFGCARRWSK